MLVLTVRGRVVEVEVRFLETFAMIALGVAQPEQSFLQELVLLVPEREGDILQAVGV